MTPLTFGIQGDIEGQLSHLTHTVPNIRRPFRRNGGEVAPCQGYTMRNSAGVAQVACLIQNNGEAVTVVHDCAAFISDLLVGLEELWCQCSWRSHTRSFLQPAFAGYHSSCGYCYFDVVLELQGICPDDNSKSGSAGQYLSSLLEGQERSVFTLWED